MDTTQPKFEFTWTPSVSLIQCPLTWLSKILDFRILQFINEAGRRALLHIYLPLLNRLRIVNGVKFYPRHSAVTGLGFNLVVSDLDLAAVFTRSPKEETLNLLASRYKKIRKIVPWSGELEIYTNWEWAVRNRIRKQPEMSELLQVLWVLRKTRWLSKKIPSGPYHLYKNHRAIEHCLDFFSQQSEQERLRRIFSNLGILSNIPKTEIHYYCDYLSQTIHFEAPIALALLAVLPPAQELPSELQKAVEDLRKIPEIKNTRRLILLYEWIVARSRQRTHPAPLFVAQGWFLKLRQALSDSGAIRWAPV